MSKLSQNTRQLKRIRRHFTSWTKCPSRSTRIYGTGRVAEDALVILRLVNKSFEAIDALFLQRRDNVIDFYGAQVTASSKHPIKMRGLKNVAEKLLASAKQFGKESKIYVVFAPPPKKHQRTQFSHSITLLERRSRSMLL